MERRRYANAVLGYLWIPFPGGSFALKQVGLVWFWIDFEMKCSQKEMEKFSQN